MSTTSTPNRENMFAFTSFRSWVKVLWKYRKSIDFSYKSHIIETTISSLLTSPLRFYERVRYNGILKKTRIEQPPIFIVGFPRTGTTHLHNILSKDAELGYVSTFQAAASGFYLMGDKKIKPKLEEYMPATRSMDNVALAMDNPQEEEVAIANMCPYSYYHHLSFPSSGFEMMDKYVLFTSISEKEIKKWQKVYMKILKKTTYNTGGKRLLLKSPTNTGRIKILLEMFPDAKFIHIHRDPYAVFYSLRNLYYKTLPSHQLEEYTNEEVEERVLVLYKKMMGKYLLDRDLIPKGNLSEIRFEDLEQQALPELRRVYEELRLNNTEEALSEFEKYLKTISGYQKNKFEFDSEDVEKVNREWAFAFDEWEYRKR